MKTILKSGLPFIKTTFIILNTALFAQAPDTLWTRTFDRSGSDQGHSVQQTTDGGYIIAGSSDLYYWLIKTDANGDTLWTKSFSSIGINEGRAVEQTTDGGYILIGSSGYLIKTDGNGETLWTKTFADSNSVLFISVQQTSDEGYIISGSISIDENCDIYLIKTDANGDTLWTKTIEGSSDDQGNSVHQTTDGGYIITGRTGFRCCGRIPNLTGDPWLIKSDANGDTLWTNIFGDDGWSDWGNSVQQTSDGGYIITGRLAYYISLIKTDANGDTLWTKTFWEGSGNSVQETTDGGYIITGTTLLIRTDTNGDTLWTKAFNIGSDDRGNSVEKTTDGGYIVCGTTRFNGENTDVWLIKVAPDITSIGENPHVSVNDYRLHQNYPNPFNPSTTIEYTLPKSEFVELKVYNLLGEEVAELVSDNLSAGVHQYQFDGSRLASGVYYYQLVAGDYREVKKMILLR